VQTPPSKRWPKPARHGSAVVASLYVSTYSKDVREGFMPTRIVPKTELRTRIRKEWNELQQKIETLEGQIAEFEYGAAAANVASRADVYT
jgi:hypothetical protein